MRVHQFVSYLHAPGDAVADQVYAFREAFHSWGWESQVFALEGERHVPIEWQPVQRCSEDRLTCADDILLYHYAGGSALTRLLQEIPGRPVIYYHNITPHEYVESFHQELASTLRSGREELLTLRHAPSLAASEYSRRELLELGFEQVHVVPLVLQLERLHTSAQTAAGQALIGRYSDGWVNWITVGRIAPNKCCEDVIRSFAYYQKFINRRARLFLIGGYRHFEAYQFNLARLTEKWGVGEVHWCGWTSFEDGFGAYYRLGTVLVSMSEHEGFCLPLVEALSFDIPVLAYSAAAVPDTLGDAGILMRHKSYEVIAELVQLLHDDHSMRSRLLEGQRERLKQFDPALTLERLREALLSCEWNQHGTY